MLHIPITYASGTGGHFVCYLLNAAQINNHTKILLSSTGNAHNSGLGFCIGGGFVSDDTKKKTEILAYANSNEERNKFLAVHCADFEFLQASFKKIIVITYSKQNIQEISTIFSNKWRSNVSGVEHDHERIKKRMDTMLRYSTLESIYADTLLSSDYIMNLSWDNLFKGNASELVQALSKFTQIPVENFNIPNLIYWRKLTNDGLINCEK